MLRSNDILEQSDNDIRLGSGYGNQNLSQMQQPQRYVSGSERLMNAGFYGNSIGGAGSIGGGPGSTAGYYGEADNKSIASTPSKISKFTYSEYPQIRPTNPLYTSTATIKTATSAVSRASTINTVSRRQKYNPNAPRPIHDWRWIGALAVLCFFPTGVIAMGLAIKARIKFDDGFITEAKKLNKRALFFCILSFVLGAAWILTVFFIMDMWPRTYG